MKIIVLLSTGIYLLIVLAVLAVLVAIWLVVSYNRLTRARISIDNSWSQVNVQLKMRADLVPNLVNTVKGYATHEQETLTRVMEARSRYYAAPTRETAMQSGSEMAGLVGRLFAVAEQYPDLKADSNFLDLQQQLAGIEQKLALARQFYNDAVMLYNRKVMLFPSNIVAGLFGFRQSPYFEISETEKENPQVKF